MKKLLFAAIATVMASGLLLGSMGSAALAYVSDDNPGKAKGKCDPDNPGKAKGNPHTCSTGEMPPNECDYSPVDEKISISELQGLYQLPFQFIDHIEEDLIERGGDTNDNGFIDTLEEYNLLRSSEHLGSNACKPTS